LSGIEEHALPNVWALHNLRGSPFFQEALESGDGSRHPIELFVGRAGQLQRHLAVIGSAGGTSGSSRQVISGSPGVGKSSLAQAIKARATQHGYLSSPEPVALGHQDDTDAIAVRILDYLYQAIVVRGGPKVERDSAVQDVRQLIRVFRVRNLSGGLSIGVPVVGSAGASASRGSTFVTPGTVRPAVIIGDLMRRLMEVVRDKLSASGLIVHVNNLENLTEENAKSAARVLRDLRDPCLLAAGYHWLLVGTADAVRIVAAGTEQVRTVFNFGGELEPLGPEDLLELLTRRYQALRANLKMPVRPPVAPEAVVTLYGLFRGDLRGTLAALDEAAHELLGYVGESPRASLTFDDLRSVLPGIYAERVRSLLSNEGAEALRSTVATLRKDRKETFTRRELRDWLGVGQATVSRFVGELVRNGFAVEARKERVEGSKRPTAYYSLTGAARLAFGEF
jgi:hypothetical protein